MTVLVTGGCGYIGAHVVHALHQAGEQVVVVDDLSYGKPTRIEGSRLYGMDIAAPGAGERLAEIMKAEGVDSVIHFAARKQVGESVEKPLWYYQQNINGMLNVLIGMRALRRGNVDPCRKNSFCDKHHAPGRRQGFELRGSIA